MKHIISLVVACSADVQNKPLSEQTLHLGFKKHFCRTSCTEGLHAVWALQYLRFLSSTQCHSLSMTAMCHVSVSSDKQNTGDHGDEVRGFTSGAYGKPSHHESGGYAAIACSVSRCHPIASNEKNTPVLSPFTSLPSRPTSVQSDHVVWPVWYWCSPYLSQSRPLSDSSFQCTNNGFIAAFLNLCICS